MEIPPSYRMKQEESLQQRVSAVAPVADRCPWSKSNLSHVASPPALVRGLLLGFDIYSNSCVFKPGVKSSWSIKPC